MAAKIAFQIDEAGRVWTEKDPDEVLDYTIDWTQALVPLDDTIASQQVIAPTVTVDSSDFVGMLHTAWISGGTLKDFAKVTFRIVTTDGRTIDRDIFLKIVATRRIPAE